MANPFYQPPICRPTAGRCACAIRRVLNSTLASAPAACDPREPDRRRLPQDVPGRDVLWRAKRNALHRALAGHDLTVHQARVILCRLSATRDCGCELACLGWLSGFEDAVLDRAVPLLGLQNFITIREQDARGYSAPVLWISITEHGLRYAAEASSRELAPGHASAEAAVGAEAGAGT